MSVGQMYCIVGQQVCCALQFRTLPPVHWLETQLPNRSLFLGLPRKYEETVADFDGE